MAVGENDRRELDVHEGRLTAVLGLDAVDDPLKPAPPGQHSRIVHFSLEVVAFLCRLQIQLAQQNDGNHVVALKANLVRDRNRGKCGGKCQSANVKPSPFRLHWLYPSLSDDSKRSELPGAWDLVSVVCCLFPVLRRKGAGITMSIGLGVLRGSAIYD